MVANGKRKGKYASELEKLKKLNAINEVLQKGDIENAALTNVSKDSETVSDSTIDNMISKLNLSKHATKDLEIIENLSSKSKQGEILKRKHIRIKSTGRGVQVRRKIHLVKKKGKSKSRGKKR